MQLLLHRRFHIHVPFAKRLFELRLVRFRRVDERRDTAVLEAGRRLLYTVHRRDRLVRQQATPFAVAAGDGNPDAHGVAEALVKIDATGKIVGIDYPAPGWIAATSKARVTSAADVAALLATLASRR